MNQWPRFPCRLLTLKVILTIVNGFSLIWSFSIWFLYTNFSSKLLINYVAIGINRCWTPLPLYWTEGRHKQQPSSLSRHSNIQQHFTQRERDPSNFSLSLLVLEERNYRKLHDLTTFLSRYPTGKTEHSTTEKQSFSSFYFNWCSYTPWGLLHTPRKSEKCL